MHSDMDALARELSDRFRTVTEKKLETGRLVADLQRHNDMIVDLQRKIGKEEELGLGEDDWLNGVVENEDSGAKQIEGTQVRRFCRVCGSRSRLPLTDGLRSGLGAGFAG